MKILFLTLLLIKYSHYNPALGGTNCFSFVDGVCVSRMASGYRWQDWMDRAVACPKEWEFGTTIELDGKVWTCMDRGGKIRFGEDGYTYVDFLTTKGAYSYGTLVEVKITPPALNITGGAKEEERLFKRQVLRLYDLSSNEVHSPEGQYKISPRLKTYGNLSIPEFGVEQVQSETNQYTSANSHEPFNRSNRDSQLRLKEVSHLDEQVIDNWTLEYPVNYKHRHSVCY